MTQAPFKSAAKWCAHCRKADHSDSECWSTRAVAPEPDSGPLSDVIRLVAERYANPVFHGINCTVEI